MEGLETFVFPAIGRILDKSSNECVQLLAGAVHPVEVSEHTFRLRTVRFLYDHAEKIVHGYSRRLHFLTQEGDHRAA